MYNSKRIKEEGYYVELYYYGSTHVLANYKNRVPVFEADLTVEKPDKFWLKLEGVIDFKERGQLIYGESNDCFYRGKIQCGCKIFMNSFSSSNRDSLQSTKNTVMPIAICIGKIYQFDNGRYFKRYTKNAIVNAIKNDFEMSLSCIHDE